MFGTQVIMLLTQVTPLGVSSQLFEHLPNFSRICLCDFSVISDKMNTFKSSGSSLKSGRRKECLKNCSLKTFYERERVENQI